MTQTTGCAIGVDLGGTKIEVARVNKEGRLEQRTLIKTDVKGGPSAVMAEIVAAARDLRKTAATLPEAVGVAVAGQIDEERGIVRFAPNLGWHDVPLAATLSSALEVPVILMNDVRAATWGEWLHGAGRECADLICVFAGTGIGGGVVSGGRMLTGCTNTAGEIGHMTIQLDGPPCTCRNTGCLEALAGGWAIAKAAKMAIKQDPAAGAYLLSLADGELDHVTTKLVAQAMEEGDPLAVRLINTAGRALTAGVVSLVNAFNPCRLILGGGVIEGVPELTDKIREGVMSSALTTAINRLEIVRAELRHDAGVIGMAAYALRVSAEGKLGRSAA
jgi:glucokinase